jgi:putative ABC transport system permease protein
MFRHAFRSLSRRPAFAVLAVLTLAIGIGANTAIFSVVNGVLLRPLPYPQPDRLVALWEHTSRAPRVHVSFPNFRDWHDRSKSFQAIAAYGGDTTTVLGGAFVHRFLPHENPIGRRFRYEGMDSKDEPMLTIVGVARDVRSDALEAPIVPEAYVSYLQRPLRTRWSFVVTARARDGVSADALMTPLRRTLVDLDPDVPVKIGTMEQRVGASVADRRFTMAVLSTFAFVAVLLAAIGIYSLLAQSVAQRTAEIGVRMALGAGGPILLRLVVTTMMGPVVAGIAAGLLIAVFTVKLMASFLFGVHPLDPAAFSAAAAMLAGVALVAADNPARRATRVDPVRALRAT